MYKLVKETVSTSPDGFFQLNFFTLAQENTSLAFALRFSGCFWSERKSGNKKYLCSWISVLVFIISFVINFVSVDKGLFSFRA